MASKKRTLRRAKERSVKEQRRARYQRQFKRGAHDPIRGCPWEKYTNKMPHDREFDPAKTHAPRS